MGGGRKGGFAKQCQSGHSDGPLLPSVTSSSLFTFYFPSLSLSFSASRSSMFKSNYMQADTSERAAGDPVNE